MSASPYRVPDRPAVIPPHEPPRDLVCAQQGDEPNSGLPRLVLQSLLLCGVVATLLSWFQLELTVPLAIVGTIAWAIWRWRTRDVGGLLLRVDWGELTVTRRGANGRGPALLRMPLADLRDVQLQTKEMQRAMRASSIAWANVQTGLGAKTDIGRVVLVPRAPNVPFYLMDAFVSHTEATELFGKVRAFLRSHGWLPVDERPCKKKRAVISPAANNDAKVER